MASTRVCFLVGAAAIIFHVSIVPTCIVIAGNLVFEAVDVWLAKRARNKAVEALFEDETEWELDKNDPEWEQRGSLARLRLPGKDQIIVTRVADILRRLQMISPT